MRFYVIVAIILGLTTIVYAQDKAVSFSGTVVDFNTNRPVHGAIVTTVGAQNKVDAVTDQDGYFTLPLKDGFSVGQVIRLNISKAGYEVFDENRVVGAAGTIQPILHLRSLHSTPPKTNYRQSPVTTKDTVKNISLTSMVLREIDTIGIDVPDIASLIVIPRISSDLDLDVALRDAKTNIAISKMREYISSHGFQTKDISNIHAKSGQLPKKISEVKSRFKDLKVTAYIEVEVQLKKDEDTYAALLTTAAINVITGKTIYFKVLSSGYFETDDINLLIDKALKDNGEGLINSLKSN